MDNRVLAVQNNIGLVHSLARRFRGRGVEYEDLVQVGCVGLLKALDGFDETRGVKFSTYAVPVILGEIRHIFRDGGMVKVSRSLKDLSRKISFASEKFCIENGREPTVNELAQVLQVDPAQVAQAIDACTLPLSLSAQDGPCEIEIPVASHDEKISERIALQQVVGTLGPLEEAIIKLRFFQNLTQTQAGQRLGMSQVQVSRQEKKILGALRRHLA